MIHGNVQTDLQQHFTGLVKQLTAAGIDTPELDARLLLAKAAGLAPEILNLFHNTPINEAQLAADKAQRLAHKPMAKILGYKQFYSLDFLTTTATLDPRPDSETLIDLVRRHVQVGCALHILDLGTGTGCLLLTLLHYYPAGTGVGIDICPDALAIAEKNALILGLQERCTFHEGDMLSDISDTFNLIISNPPYIPNDHIATLEESVKDYEPTCALDGGADGLDFYKRIAASARPCLRDYGLLALEVGHDQAPAVRQIMQQNSFRLLDQQADLNGHTRALLFGV